LSILYHLNLTSYNTRNIHSFPTRRSSDLTYERVKEVSEAQMDSLNHFEESVGELKSFTSSIMEEQQSIHNKFENITQKSHDLAEKMEAHNQDFKQVFGSDLSSKLTGIITNLGDLSKDFDKMGGSSASCLKLLK